MRLGLVVYGSLDQTSGGFRYDRKLVEYLRNNGDTVEVISVPWRSYWRTVADGFSPGLRSRLNRPFDALIQDELCHPTLWWVNNRLTRPKRTVALVHHVQSDEQPDGGGRLRRYIESQYLSSVDSVIATSEFTRQRVRRLAPDVSEWLVAPPAGRHEGRAIRPSAIRERAHQSPLRIVYLGNLLPRKNLLGLLAALERLTDDHNCTDWRLSVLGSQEADPAYAERIRTRLAELGFDDRIDILGEVSDRTVEQTLEASHVLCVPSIYEGFGMVYLEAMEYGVVPIASANGGASEFVHDGKNGALVDPGAAERIAHLLAEWAADRSKLATLGLAAANTADDHPSWAETFASIRSLCAGEPAGDS